MNDPENKDQGKGFKGLHGLGTKKPEPTSEPPEITTQTVEPNLPAAWQGHEQSGQRDKPQHPHRRTAAPKRRGRRITLSVIGAAVRLFYWLSTHVSTKYY